ncbi:MAG: transcription termination/antitermination protein NusG [Candidatus Puniceispirillaceae bacterium]
MAKRWYVLHVFSGSEKKVAQSIREQAVTHGLEDQVEDVMVPTENVVEVKRGVRVEGERKFFPGYILVKLELSDEAWQMVTSQPRVTGFLGGKGRPIPITDKEAERLIRQVSEGVERPRTTITFDVGEQVRVADGPFASFNGYVEEADDDKARLKVAVSIFGRSTPVELEYSQVEKI